MSQTLLNYLVVGVIKLFCNLTVFQLIATLIEDKCLELKSNNNLKYENLQNTNKQHAMECYNLRMFLVKDH